MTNIPEGFALIAETGKAAARASLDAAVAAGFPEDVVVAVQDGFLVPESALEHYGVEEVEVEEVTLPTKAWNKEKIEDFAATYNITLPEGGTKVEYLAAIDAEIERRTAEAEATGVLTDGSEDGSDDGDEQASDETDDGDDSGAGDETDDSGEPDDSGDTKE